MFDHLVFKQTTSKVKDGHTTRSSILYKVNDDEQRSKVAGNQDFRRACSWNADVLAELITASLRSVYERRKGTATPYWGLMVARSVEHAELILGLASNATWPGGDKPKCVDGHQITSKRNMCSL